jgi:hypothetical protein
VLRDNRPDPLVRPPPAAAAAVRRLRLVCTASRTRSMSVLRSDTCRIDEISLLNLWVDTNLN